MYKIIPSLLLIGFFFSCRKAEQPVAKHEAGSVKTESFTMGSDYRFQGFFDIETNRLVKKNIKTIWDLGFENGENGHHIILNSANAMAAAKVENKNFESITDTSGLQWSWDVHSGNLDSTAIGNWQNQPSVFVIDKGRDSQGIARGFCKIVPISVNSNEYTLKISDLNNQNTQTVTIAKNNTLNFVAFSCSELAIVDVEPHKENWDIQFTQYIHYFEKEDEAYLVTGILNNRNKVEVAEINDKSFQEIEFKDIENSTFNKAINTIGFDWKFFDFSTATYIVDASKNYIIKTTEGFYYKLHFIDFYNELGEKGTPVFEFQKL